MKHYRYNIPIDPNPACFSQIGEIATRWGWIENQVTVLIRLILRMTKPESYAAILSMGMQSKLGLLRSLAELAHKGKPLEIAIIKLAQDIQRADKFRNDMIHGLWVHYPEGTNQLALLRRKSIEQKINPEPDAAPAKQLVTKIGELKAIQAEAQRITDVLKNRGPA